MSLSQDQLKILDGVVFHVTDMCQHSLDELVKSGHVKNTKHGYQLTEIGRHELTVSNSGKFSEVW